MTRKGTTKPQFQFVSVTPEVTGDHVAKADQRRLVRSNAAIFQWRRQKEGGRKRVSSDKEIHSGSDGGNIDQELELTKSSSSRTSATASNKTSTGKRKSRSRDLSPENDMDRLPATRANSGNSNERATYFPSPQQYTVVSPIDQAGQELRYSKYCQAKITACLF